VFFFGVLSESRKESHETAHSRVEKSLLELNNGFSPGASFLLVLCAVATLVAVILKHKK